MRTVNVKRIKVLFLFGMVLLLSVACSKGNDVAIENQSETTKEIVSYDLTEGMDMPNVVVETNKGNNFDLSKTDKPALINFWATWCPPCREEMPSLQNLYEEYGNKIDFVMIDSGETKEAVQSFLVENEVYTFPIGYDTDNTYGFKFNIMAIPTTYIVGKDKKIKNVIVGMRTEEQYKEFIEKAIIE